MRTDMKKVLTERPRYGHHRSYHDVRPRTRDFDNLPSCEGMRRPYGWDDRKEFSDLLGPLIRYLHSSIGRLWNDVWSEICGQLSNNTVDSHLKGHVISEVETNTKLIDGVPCVCSRFRGYADVDGLYVDPATGRLQYKENKRNYPKTTCVDRIAYRRDEYGVLWPYGMMDGRVNFARKIIGPEQEAVLIDRIWYWVVFATVPDPFSDGLGRVIHVLRDDFITGVAVRHGRYRDSKRQMSARDLRKHGLINGVK